MIGRRAFIASCIGFCLAKKSDYVPALLTPSESVLSGGSYAAHCQRITISTDLGRTELYELGRKRPYYQYIKFPDGTFDRIIGWGYKK